MAHSLNAQVSLTPKMVAECSTCKSRVSCYLLLVLWAVFPPNTQAAEPLAVTGWELVRQMKSGGFNIYFRHAETDWTQLDGVDAPGDWRSCDPTRIRQLSDIGRRNASRVGKAIRALDLPIGKVFASPYCRTMETATIMEIGIVESSNDIINLRVADYFGGRGAVIETARRALATKPASGTNSVFVAHGNVVREATLIYPAEAEGVVFRPDGVGGIDYVARLTPDQWDQLVTLVNSQL
jgi:phosphohistidine phosphatase SixA